MKSKPLKRSAPRVQYKSGAKSQAKDAYTGDFKDRNLMAINPLQQQFEPTDAEPVRQHARMAGTC